MYKIIRKMFAKEIEAEIESAKTQAKLEGITSVTAKLDEEKLAEKKVIPRVSKLCINFKDGNSKTIVVNAGQEKRLHKLIQASYNTKSNLIYVSTRNEDRKYVRYFNKADIHSMELSVNVEA